MSIFDYFKKNKNENESVNGFEALEQPVGEERINQLNEILNRYKSGKANTEKRALENYKYYKLRQWELMRDGKDKKAQQVEPKSAWLFNAIANKHADAMDNFPSPNILPREENDKAEAKRLSSIVPVILDQCEFEQTYSDAWWDKIVTGTAVYGVFWDGNKLNGLGDIDIQRINLLNLYWEPGITDIQQSRYVFHVELADNESLLSQYPQLKDKLGGGSKTSAKYEYDESVDTTDKSQVVDCYYKVQKGNKTILHYIKYVNSVVLFATENSDEYKETGWYEHGQYPFVFDTLFPNAGTPAGFGYIDIGRDAQNYIDRVGQAILKNTLIGATPRFFAPNNSNVNEEEYADLTKGIVHCNGQAGDIQPIVTKGLDGAYINVLDGKINELKEVTGNRDISTGGTASGVTAASAIAAMQEAGSKLSRDASKAAYRAYKQLILLIIELIRQFYDVSRSFRITGENGDYQFETFSNENIRPQPQGEIANDGTVMPEMGVDVLERIPLFDVEITAQKQSPYSKMSQNELALQLYQLGFFNPELADQALSCLDMMDFDRKDSVIQKISNNSQLLQALVNTQQQALALAQMVDEDRGSNIAQEMAMGINGAMSEPVTRGNIQPNVADKQALGGEGISESNTTKKARQHTAEMTNPT